MSDINVGRRIKNVRELRGLSGKEFSEMIDITTKYLYEIEAGKRNFSTDILCRMAENLEVSCDYIMLGKDSLDSNDMEPFLLLESMNKQQMISLKRVLKVLCDISAAF